MRFPTDKKRGAASIDTTFPVTFFYAFYNMLANGTITEFSATLAIATSLWRLRLQRRLARLRARLGWVAAAAGGPGRDRPGLVWRLEAQAAPPIAAAAMPANTLQPRQRPAASAGRMCPIWLADMEVVEGNGDADWYLWELASGWGDASPAHTDGGRPA